MPAIGRTFISAVICLLVAAAARGDATLFRLFLTDGTNLVSFGEYARVADKVVFSMPVGGTIDQPRLYLVTLPANRVDWARTDRYAESARLRRFADTRGQEEFVRLTNDVARVLNEIAQTTDRSQALAHAEAARQALVGWTRTHYGYGEQDVREIVAVLDESIANLRAALGVTSFDLAPVPDPAPASTEPLLGMPGAREQLDQVFHVAAMVDRPADRVALLQSALLLIREAGAAVPTADAERLRQSAEAQIHEEQLVDASYAQLSRRLMSSATEAASHARPRDVERVLGQLPLEDAKLGGRRPEAVDALRTSLQQELENARRLRLAEDQWTMRRSLYRDYERAIEPQLAQLVKIQPALESIRRLEGPSPQSVLSLRKQLAGGAVRLSRVQTPQELRPVHDLIVGAWRFAESAVNRQYDAIQSGNVATAREASSAAASAISLFGRAQQEIQTLLEPPRER